MLVGESDWSNMSAASDNQVLKWQLKIGDQLDSETDAIHAHIGTTYGRESKINGQQIIREAVEQRRRQ